MGSIFASMDNEKAKLRKEALEKINKNYGQGTVMLLSDKAESSEDVVSTGSLGLDKATGIGGLARGRIYEIYGPESSGKSTLSIHAMAECQKAGGSVIVIDTEHSFDEEYAANLGMDVDSLLITQPDYGEQALDIAEQMISSGGIDMVVIDSVANLTPQSEIEGDMGQSKMGLQARLMSQALRKLTAIVSKKNVILIFINQMREKIGVMFGNPETTTGGNALKFYASMRFDIRRIGFNKEKEDGEIVSIRSKVKVVKNKLAPPFKTAEFNIVFGEGIDTTTEIIDMGAEYGIIQKSGSWYSYNNDKIGQGAAQVKKLLKDNPELEQEIKNKIKERCGNG